MRIISGLMIAALFLFGATGACLASADADPSALPGDLELRVHAFIAGSMATQDLLEQCRTAPNDEAYAHYEKQQQRLAGDLAALQQMMIAAVEAGNTETIQDMCRIWRSLDELGRQTLHPVISQMESASLHTANRSLREYLPGYGYTESGYQYRKGLELDREFKGNRWQDEELTVTTNVTAKLTITLDLVGMFQDLAASGVIRNLKVGEPYEVQRGEPLLVVNISFEAVKSLVTKTQRRFEINKVWFELFRRKTSYSSSAPWDLVGKTYVIMQEPTGDQIVTGVKSQE